MLINKQYKKRNNNSKNPTWIYKQGRGDFWFVDIEVDGEKKGYYVHERNKLDALNNDEVTFQIKEYRGKDEAVILKVNKRSENTIVWVLHIPKGKEWFGFFVPNNPFFDTDVFIPGKFFNWAKHGDTVWVQVHSWSGRNPEGKIVENLWPKWTKRMDILALAIEWGARLKFRREVLSEVERLEDNMQSELTKRKDIRNTFTFTIDWEDSKDLDDAISIEKTGDTYKLSVHIADVSHYVREWTRLDEEAQKRATSIYLVNKVIPMLPEKLSNDLCSLNPDEDKLTLTCEMTIGKAWEVLKSEVYESVIKSDFRLTYKDVEEMTTGVKLEKTWSWKAVTPELSEAIDNCKNLKKILTTRKEKSWVLNFDFPEAKIEVDDNDFPTYIGRYERYNSHKIIEEFMVLANEAVSKKFSKNPFLYRIHEKPNDADLVKLIPVLHSFDIVLNSEKVNTKAFSEILEKVKWKPSEKFLQKTLLRSLSKAVYSDDALGHFGLGLEFYSHFTSPIRRYPDLQIHRIIKELLVADFSPAKKIHYSDILPWIANHCSEKERAAEGIEYKVKDLMAVKYMKDKIGQKFDAVVSGIIQKGFFVELDNTIEWFVETPGWVWDFDDEFMILKNVQTWKKYTIGDMVQVELDSVQEAMLRINFRLV